MLNPTQQKALAALLTCPTKTAAAQKAGIAVMTMRRYLANPEFQQEYRRAFSELVTDATRQAQQALSPALSALRDIVEDSEEAASSRIGAARALLEYGLRLTEFSDILRDLEAASGES